MPPPAPPSPALRRKGLTAVAMNVQRHPSRPSAAPAVAAPRAPCTTGTASPPFVGTSTLCGACRDLAPTWPYPGEASGLDTRPIQR